LSNDYSNWCPEIFRNLFVDRFNQDAIRIAPCCQAKPVIVSIDQFDFATNEHLTSLRVQNQDNQRTAECNACWQAEDMGQRSRRQWAVSRFDRPTYEVVLEGIDHSATWACNLACVMCGPENSSSWAAELDLTSDQLSTIGRKYQKLNNFTDKIDLSSVIRLHFNGGEPLLTNEHLDLLNYFDNKDLLKNLIISYNTNGTVAPTSAVLDLWSRAKQVTLFFSVDGIGPVFDYIRWPGQWNNVSENILRIKHACPGVRIGFNVTIGNYNILEVGEIWNWFVSNINSDGTDFNVQMVNKFTCQLPSEAVAEVVNQLAGIAIFQGLVDSVGCNNTLAQGSGHWTKRLESIDQRRGTSWRTALKIGKYY
jgi:uncharacterized Fe-S cluster-containing radical SAM superfamily protein